jgi:D-amino-acid oxidase
MVSYHMWKTPAESEIGHEVGVQMVRSAFFFSTMLEENEEHKKKMVEMKNAGVHVFSHDISLFQEIDSKAAIADACELLAPAIDTDKATHGLTSLVRSKGAHFCHRRNHDRPP